MCIRISQSVNIHDTMYVNTEATNQKELKLVCRNSSDWLVAVMIFITIPPQTSLSFTSEVQRKAVTISSCAGDDKYSSEGFAYMHNILREQSSFAGQSVTS